MSIENILNFLNKNKQARLFIRVLPGSSLNKIMEIEELEPGQFKLKIKLTAQPIEGKANQALLEFLHRQLKLPKFCFRIILGDTSKNKTLLITLPS